MCYRPSDVKSWLEWAGRRVLMMPSDGPQGFRVFWPDIVPEMFHDTRSARLSKLRPTAKEIPYIDEILELVVVIPNQRRRRIVSYRALVTPRNQRQVWGWDRLAEAVKIGDTRIVRQEHRRGLVEICELTPCDKMRRIGGFLGADSA